MAVSGTINFGLDIDSVIREAIENVGGEPTLGEEGRSARRSLNLLLIDWQNRGIPLWKRDTQSFPVVEGTSSYTLTAGTIDVMESVCRRNSIDLDMERMTPEEYLQIARKDQDGRPTQYYIDRQRASTLMYLWPVPENSTDEVVYWRFTRIFDVNSSNEDPDVPFRFLPSLTTGLAYYMALKRTGIPIERIALLKGVYEENLKVAMEEDRDRASLKLVPKMRPL